MSTTAIPRGIGSVPRTFGARVERVPESRQWAWLTTGLIVAFVVPFLFADVWPVGRDAYYGIYVTSVAAFFALWLHYGTREGRRVLTRHWRAGLVLGLGFGGIMVPIALTAQPTSHPQGWSFAGALVWRGVVYGAADGLLLSAFPILAVFAAFETRPLRERPRRAVAAIGALALAMSVAFTAVYHLGYPDFRGSKLRKPLAGDLIWSMPTLLTLSPIGAPLAHAGLHMTAVIHSYDTDVFLPPHRAAATLERPQLQRLLETIAADPTVAPGAVGFVLTPTGSWSGAAGFADLQARTPVTADDAFRIFSLTKTYVATVVLQLVQEGKLQLSDTVGELLPNALPADKGAITVRQLLSHTSGLYDAMSDGLGALVSSEKTRAAFLASIHDPAIRRQVTAIMQRRNPFSVFPAKIWVDIAGSQPLYFAPGTGYHYSNPGYVLLGWIVERTTKQPLALALQKRIFDPLGLHHSWYLPGPALPEPYAHGYVLPNTFGSNFFPATAQPIDATRITLGLAGASSIVATAEDVARFYAALLGGKLLQPRTLDELMLSEGMGIGGYPTPCRVGYGHNGAFLNYAAAARVSADGKTAAVLLLNARGPNADARVDEGVAALFCQTTPATP